LLLLATTRSSVPSTKFAVSGLAKAKRRLKVWRLDETDTL
jgi:hypothetical protein